MSCSECQNSCGGEEDFPKRSLYFDIGYRSSDCAIDDTDTPWWVTIEIDSSRGNRWSNTGGVHVRVELTSSNGMVSIDSTTNTKEKHVPGNSSGTNIEFKISQSSGSNPPKSEELKLDIDWKKSSSDPYQDLEEVYVNRRLSDPP